VGWKNPCAVQFAKRLFVLHERAAIPQTSGKTVLPEWPKLITKRNLSEIRQLFRTFQSGDALLLSRSGCVWADP
jgi:hypothetical protein